MAMTRGTHAYIEKPLATDLASAQEVFQVWQQSNLVGMIGLNLRRNPLYQKARQIVQSGQLGRVVAVRSVFGSSRREQPSWRESHAMGGGALLNLSPHPIDMIGFLLDSPIEEVFAHRPTVEPDLTMTLQLRLKGGLLAQAVLSMVSYSADEIEIVGDEATLFANRRAAKLTLLPPDAYDSSKKRLMHELASMAKVPKQILRARGEPSYLRALSAFVEAVQTGNTDVKPDVADGLRVQSVIEAAWESANSGHPAQVKPLT
jgi:predicted dehydrogenase